MRHDHEDQHTDGGAGCDQADAERGGGSRAARRAAVALGIGADELDDGLRETVGFMLAIQRQTLAHGAFERFVVDAMGRAQSRDGAVHAAELDETPRPAGIVFKQSDELAVFGFVQNSVEETGDEQIEAFERSFVPAGWLRIDWATGYNLV